MELNVAKKPSRQDDRFKMHCLGLRFLEWHAHSFCCIFCIFTLLRDTFSLLNTSKARCQFHLLILVVPDSSYKDKLKTGIADQTNDHYYFLFPLIIM